MYCSDDDQDDCTKFDSYVCYSNYKYIFLLNVHSKHKYAFLYTAIKFTTLKMFYHQTNADLALQYLYKEDKAKLCTYVSYLILCTYVC